MTGPWDPYGQHGGEQTGPSSGFGSGDSPVYQGPSEPTFQQQFSAPPTAQPEQPAPAQPGRPAAPYPPQPYPGQPFPQQLYQPAASPPPAAGGGRGWLWALLGGLALVVVVVVALAVTLSSSHSSGGGAGRAAGKYTFDKVNNACDVADFSAATRWAANADGTPTHREDKSQYVPSLNCEAKFTAQGGTDAYQNNSADVTFEAYLGDKYTPASKSYNQDRGDDFGRTGSGYDSGDIPGLGQKAYFHSELQNYSDFMSDDYKCEVLDDNLYFSINLDIEYYGSLAESDVQPVCVQIAQSVLDNATLKK
jgi:hypothetical protein